MHLLYLVPSILAGAVRDLLCRQLSKLGLGCLGLTGAYDLPLDDEAGAAVVVHAFRRGVT